MYEGSNPGAQSGEPVSDGLGIEVSNILAAQNVVASLGTDVGANLVTKEASFDWQARPLDHQAGSEGIPYLPNQLFSNSVGFYDQDRPREDLQEEVWLEQVSAAKRRRE
jgi:hypothetical protein